MRYDVVVVGARCAGSPLAMLLARAGHRVLVLDRAAFPSDTLSTHWLLTPGVRLLEQWGLLDALAATGCPPITRIRLDAEGEVVDGEPGDTTYAPRRRVLDALLLEAAQEAGAEVRQGTSVGELLWRDGRVAGVVAQDGDGGRQSVEARWVVGADGRNSTVARLVGADPFVDHGALAATVYGYWSGVATSGAEIRIRPGLGLAMWPTHDGLTTVAATVPRSAFRDCPGGAAEVLRRAVDRLPEVAERLAAGRPAEPARGAQQLRNFFRPTHGPGWALAGDAGHHKDPIGARGISDAFTDAADLAEALDATLTGRLPEERALARFRARRDAGRAAAFQFVCRQAELAPLGEDFHAAVRAARADAAEARRLLALFSGGRRLEQLLLAGAPEVRA